jgi:predicted membrane metal-binding protein
MPTQLDDLARAHALAIWFASYALGIVAFAYHAPVALIVGALVVAASPLLVPVAPAVARATWFCAGWAVVGLLAAHAAEWQRQRDGLGALDSRHVTCVVETLERARPSSNGSSLRVRILAVSGASGFEAHLRDRVALLELPAETSVARIAGDRLRVRARVDIPTGPRNDGEPSERDQLADQGVSLILTVHRPKDVVDGGPAAGWDPWWARLRARFADAVESRLPPLEATVLEGVLWGDRGNLPASLRQEFSDTGTVHVLTTAGLHLGIMAAFVAALLSLTPLP